MQGDDADVVVTENLPKRADLIAVVPTDTPLVETTRRDIQDPGHVGKRRVCGWPSPPWITLAGMSRYTTVFGRMKTSSRIWPPRTTTLSPSQTLSPMTTGLTT